MSFINSRKKLKTIWETNEQNKNDVSQIFKMTVKVNSDTFLKKIQVIPICIKSRIDSSGGGLGG